ncbi:MAG: hypothetical protein WC965_01235 [Thiohalomonadaceae bacterium]
MTDGELETRASQIATRVSQLLEELFEGTRYMVVEAWWGDSDNGEDDWEYPFFYSVDVRDGDKVIETDGFTDAGYGEVEDQAEYIVGMIAESFPEVNYGD